ncbi:NmrA-like family domain-containing protein 1 [Rhizoctonia solani AG-1 IB]|uniref:NmrA-like family domain-containing protein 1 n=1 Tax=Thanatephorus cucumeris (strain AG1-IB / isolate 7/3/14) TaxID=1108050 RepID=M5C6A0_THACB|nr:NmrA-like family domain-containing protein 1 [Rhizoctonia solani AG-1 IB]
MPTAIHKPLVVVCGATGAQGSSVVEHLLQDGGYRVRALTRNPDGAPAQRVETVKCDFGSLEQVVIAFQGAYAVYGVTNFWEHGEEAEIQQGKNLADAAKTCGVRHFIWPSLPHVPIIEPRHWESKIKVEKYLNEIGIPTTVLLTPFFFENLYRVLPIMRLADAEDIGAWVLIALKNPKTWVGRRLGICVQKLTPRDYASTLTEALNIPVTLREVSEGQFEAVRPHVPDDLWLK